MNQIFKGCLVILDIGFVSYLLLFLFMYFVF